MTCDVFGPVLVQAAYEPLSEEDRRRVEEHVKECPTCRREYDAVREFLSGLPQSAETPPDDFFAGQRAAIMGKISAERASAGWHIFRSPVLKWAPLAAALAAVGVWFARPPRPAPGPRDVNVELVQHLDMMEHLDLLEGWEEMETRGRA